MSIMQKIFGAVIPQQHGNVQQQAAAPASAQPAAQEQKTPGNIPAANANPASATNPMAPAASVAATVVDPNNPVSQLDAFTKLWENDPNAKPKTPEPIFKDASLDNMQKIAQGNDFSRVVTPEIMTQIQAGGPEATQALLNVMQSMAQKGFGDSAFATTQMIEQALTKQREMLMAELPTLIKSQNVSENLRNQNPIFNHPAAAPMLDALKQQVLLKNPNATVAEIESTARSYLEAFGSAVVPQKQSQDASTGAGAKATDWSTFLEN